MHTSNEHRGVVQGSDNEKLNSTVDFCMEPLLAYDTYYLNKKLHRRVTTRHETQNNKLF